ncbi:hypothetical protein, partial [Kerstersia similis]|uniref:hypothetical protein n=1 Tax=Kerstersia similis TaxID=206505 RepID=UPI0039EE5FBA
IGAAGVTAKDALGQARDAGQIAWFWLRQNFPSQAAPAGRTHNSRGGQSTGLSASVSLKHVRPCLPADTT